MPVAFCVVCDNCDATPATLFCQSDGCFLCDACDTAVHCNKITQRHVRCHYAACPIWAYHDAKARGRVMQQLGSNALPNGSAAPLLGEEDFELVACWGSSPGAAPMAIDGDNAHPFGFGAGCLVASSPPSGGSGGATAHSTANGHPASVHGGGSDMDPRMSSPEHASHPSLADSHHSLSSHLHDSQREQILRAAASATAALLPSPLSDNLPPSALELQFGELHDVSDLLPSRRSLERGGFEGSSHLQGGDEGGLSRPDGGAWLPGDEPMQASPRRDHSSHLETLLEEFCTVPPPGGADPQHELDLLHREQLIHVVADPHPSCEDSRFFAEQHRPLSIPGGAHLFPINPFSPQQRYDGRQHYNASCDGSTHGSSPQTSAHTGSGLARSHHASAGGSVGNAHTLAGELRSQSSCPAPMMYTQPQQPYVQQHMQQQQHLCIPLQQQQQQPYVPLLQQPQPHPHQRGLLSAALAAVNCPPAGAPGLPSQQQQQQQWSIRAALQYQEEQQRLQLSSAPVGCYPGDSLAASLRHTGGTPCSSLHRGGAAGTTATATVQQQYGQRQQYARVFDDGTGGGAFPAGFTFSAPPDPNLLSEVCGGGSPGGSYHGGGRAYHGGAVAAAVGGGYMPITMMAMGGTEAPSLAYSSMHGASAYGPTSDGSVRNGCSFYPPQQQQQQQQGSLSRQGSATMPLPQQLPQAQPMQQQQPQQPPPPQRLGSLSRHSSQQQLLHLQRQVSGGIMGGAPPASIGGEGAGTPPSMLYDSLLNGSMRGANLAAASLQQQQQQQPVGKRSLDLSGAPPAKGSRGIVLDLADVPELGLGLQQQQAGRAGAGFPRMRSALVLSHSQPALHDGTQSAALLPLGGGSGHGGSLACNALSAGSGVLQGTLATWAGGGGPPRSAGSAQEGGATAQEAPLLLPTCIQRADGSFREVDPLRAMQLHRYRLKRLQRLKAFADGQRKIRYECRKVLADARPRFKGRFAKEVLTGGDCGLVSPRIGGGGGALVHTWGDPSSRHPAGSVRSFGAGLDSEAAAQLRRAMSAINLEAVALALAQSKQQKVQQQRERGGGGGSGAGGTMRGGAAAAADLITDLEFEELLGAPSNKVVIERPSTSAGNSAGCSGPSGTSTETASDSPGGRGGGMLHRPIWPLQQQRSASSALEGALGHSGGGGGRSLHGGAQGLLDAILADAYQP